LTIAVQRPGKKFVRRLIRFEIDQFKTHCTFTVRQIQLVQSYPIAHVPCEVCVHVRFVGPVDVKHHSSVQSVDLSWPWS